MWALKLDAKWEWTMLKDNISSNNVDHIELQLNKLKLCSKWAHMDLGINKCAVNGCLDKPKILPLAFPAHLKEQNINHKYQQLSILSWNIPYTHLGIWRVPSLKWPCKNKTQLYSSHHPPYNKKSKSSTQLPPGHWISLLRCPFLNIRHKKTRQPTHQTHQIHLQYPQRFSSISLPNYLWAHLKMYFASSRDMLPHLMNN